MVGTHTHTHTHTHTDHLFQVCRAQAYLVSHTHTPHSVPNRGKTVSGTGVPERGRSIHKVIKRGKSPKMEGGRGGGQRRGEGRRDTGGWSK